MIFNNIYQGKVGETPIQNSYSKVGGGYQTPFLADVENKLVTIISTTDDVPADWNEKDYCAIPKEEKSTHPFLIGQTIKIAEEDRKIESISRVGDNLVLTMSGENLVEAPSAEVTIIPQSNTENYEIEDFKYLASYTPIKKLKGKLNIPIDSYTDYAVNVGGNSLVNSLYIKAVNNACSSIISIPIKSSTDSIVEDSYRPDTQGISKYNYWLNGLNVPNSDVSCKEFQTDDGQTGNWSAEAIKEMELALQASHFPVNTLRNPWDCFFIGRKLADTSKGYTSDLNNEDVRLNVSFNHVSPTLMHNFVNHRRVIQISGGNINVIL